MEASREQEWGANMQRARMRSQRAEQRRVPGERPAESQEKEVSPIEAGMFAAFLFVFFDVPKYVLGFIPYVGWILAGACWFIGMSLVILWLLIKRVSLFDILKKNWFSFATFCSIFVVIFIVKQRAKKLMGANSMAKKFL